MNRVFVTGNAGSGKTTLSKKIASSLGLELVGKESWVIDGVSSQVFQAADTIFFLDIPLHRCIINIIKRFFFNGFRTRESLPENCPEYIGVFKALRIAFIYQRLTRPHLLEMIETHKEKKIIKINSYDQVPNLNNLVI